MDTEKLLDLVKRYHENRDFISNEEAAKMALVVPFIRGLGYDPNNPREVRTEYRADFTQSDGKRFPDRMDYVIFDSTGTKPLMVIETKSLGTDLQSRSNQLARYLAQMPDLRFGIITDGCTYLFYGNLDKDNLMDREPFFRFSLDDEKADWSKTAKFLSKFSRDSFNAETLVKDAEDSRYRQAMIEKLSSVLKSPSGNEAFMKWLTHDIYTGPRTSPVKVRMGVLADEAIEPVLLRLMSTDFIEKLKQRMQRLQEPDDTETDDALITTKNEGDEGQAGESVVAEDEQPKSRIETTEEELEFYRVVRDICSKEGTPEEKILYRDTIHYFNVSYEQPWKWFTRFYGNWKRKCVMTRVGCEEARRLAPDFEVEEVPGGSGSSRVYIENVSQMWALKGLVVRSLQLLESGDSEPPSGPSAVE